MPRRGWVVAILTLWALMSMYPESIAATITGTSCSKAGITKTVSGKKYTCIKSGKKLVWDKGVAVKIAAPKPSPQPSSVEQPLPQPSQLPAPKDPITPSVGVLCPSAGQFFTVSGKDLVCVADLSGKLTWQWRIDQPQNPTKCPTQSTTSTAKSTAYKSTKRATYSTKTSNYSSVITRYRSV